MIKKLFYTSLLIIVFAMMAFPQADPKWSTEIQMSPPNPKAGDMVQFSAQLKISKGDANGLKVVCGVDGGKQFNQVMPFMPKGAIQMISFSWKATPGPHTVTFHIDPGGAFPDKNPGNNFKEKFFEVKGSGGPGPGPGGQANLVMVNTWIAPDKYSEGDIVNVFARIGNHGSVPSGPFTVVFATPKIPFKFAQAPSIKPGTGTEVSISWKVRCNSGVEIGADYHKVVPEPHKKDNIGAVMFNCGAMIMGKIIPNPKPIPIPPVLLGKPNLKITGVTWSPLSGFTHNDPVRFVYVVKNIGSHAAKPYPTVKFTVGGKIPPAGSHGHAVAPPSAGMLPGEFFVREQEVRFNCTTPYHTVRIEVDAEGRVQESNEADNLWLKSFTCGKLAQPNLAIKNVKFQKTSWSGGFIYHFNEGSERTEAEVTVINNGNHKSPPANMRIVIGIKTVFEVSILPLNPGETFQWAMYGYADCNDYFQLELDPGDKVSESNELDNKKHVSMRCYGL